MRTWFKTTLAALAALVLLTSGAFPQVPTSATVTVAPNNTASGLTPGPNLAAPVYLPSGNYITLTAIDPASAPAAYVHLQKFSFIATATAVNNTPGLVCQNNPNLGCFGEGAVFVRVIDNLGNPLTFLPLFGPDGITQLIEQQVMDGQYFEVVYDAKLQANGLLGNSDDFPVGWRNGFPAGGFRAVQAVTGILVPTGNADGTGSENFCTSKGLNWKCNVPDQFSHDLYINGGRYGSFSVNAPGRTPGFESLWPWTAYTPTVTAGSGSFSIASATGHWERVGKTVNVNGNISIISAGSGAIPIITLPVAAAPHQDVCYGIETQRTGYMWLGPLFTGGTLVAWRNFTNSGNVADGYGIIFHCAYEAAN